jgi:beta-lactamase class A
MKRILSKKMPMAYVIGLFIVVLLSTIVVTRWMGGSNTEVASTVKTCSVKIKRLEGYQHIKPLMFADEECPSESFNAVNESIQSIIGAYKQTQTVTSASVYLRDFDTAEWTVINETEEYESGSLFKVPIMMAYLKMEEQQPGTLNKVYPYTKAFVIEKEVAYQSKSIQIGQHYSVRDLLQYMIAYSDNNATALLVSKIDLKIIGKLFEDLGLQTPNFYASKFLFTAQNYSLFMRAIYNASYLTIEHSELAAKLLSESTFQNGIVSGLPKGTMIAHKFGEAGSPSEVQLHESAIVYLDNKSYLLTVMTKGKNMKKLGELLGEISKAVYENQKGTELTSI